MLKLIPKLPVYCIEYELLSCTDRKLKKVFYNSQASVGDRQYTIILFISIIFLPTILNFLNDKERGRHYHFVGFWRSPMPPSPPPSRFQDTLLS